jgi:methylated-DNA-[protein]-cysteine S-methyltransferase
MDNASKTYYHWLDRPIGKILLTANDRAITHLAFAGQKHFPTPAENWEAKPDLPIFQQAATQLDEYFQQQRQTFDLPLEPIGTVFQKTVWQQLCQIPWGQTWSYGQLAKAIGQINAARAVGAANGRNPISIFIPCHRVIATNGQLTGYAGGVERKQWLLEHEASHSAVL